MPRPDILIADELFYQRGLKVILEHRFGCAVHCTEDLDDVRSLMAKNNIGLLVIEPYMFGYSERPDAANLMSGAKARGVPVMALTSQAAEWLADKSIHKGTHYDTHFRKPTSPFGTLVPAIERIEAYRTG